MRDRLQRAFEEFPGSRHGLTRRIALRENVTDQAVGRWKRTGQVQRDHLAGLAEELGVSVEWLLTGQGAMRRAASKQEAAVPILGDTSTGVDPSLVGRQPGAEDDVVMVPRSFGPCFAVRVAGSPGLWPRYNEGEVVVVAAEAEPTVGFDVFLQRYGPDGPEASIYRLVWRVNDEVALDPVASRDQGRRLVLHGQDTMLCRPVLAILPPTLVRRHQAA
ncbi:MAG: helix-turn-helix domain-containing protein [Halomonas sp.]